MPDFRVISKKDKMLSNTILPLTHYLMSEKEMASELTQFLGQKSKVKAESETEHNTGNKLTKGKL